MKGKLVAGGAVVAAALVFGSDPLMEHIEKWETGGKPTLTVYADKLAGGLPTVCDGLTRHVTTTPIIVGETWSRAKCDRETKRAMYEKVQKPLAACLPADVPQSVFDALSSHAWNLGVARTCGSVAAQYVRMRDYETGCRRLAHSASGKPVWSTAGGRFVRGLLNRRLDEVKLCLRDVK